MRLLAHALLVLAPWRLRRWIMTRFLGHDIAPDARIGLSLIRVRHLRMAGGARIGHLNMVRGLDRLEIGRNGIIGTLNWITGFPPGHPHHFADQPARDPSLVLGDEAAVTSRHLIDCTDRVSIGDFSTLAGYRSQVLSHSIDVVASRQRAQAVSIGSHCFVGTGCIVLAGARLPDRSVLGAGSVLAKAFEAGEHLYGGAPARAVKPLPSHAAYFHREHGYVD